MKNRKKGVLLLTCALALCSAMAAGSLVAFAQEEGETETTTSNLVVNYGVEENTDGYAPNGATLAKSDEQAYMGSYSLKVSERTSGTWNAFNYDVTGISLDVWYEYSFYAYTTKEGGADVQATYSPWAKSGAGNYMWVYDNGAWTHVAENTWTRVSAVMKLSEIDGKLYVVKTDADGNESFNLVKDHNGTDEDYSSLELLRLSFSASTETDLYFDEITLEPYRKNVFGNIDVEANADGFYGNAATVARSTEYAHGGKGSVKISDRTAGVYSAFNYDSTSVELEKWYEYSFYAYTTNEGGADILASYSPWATSAAEHWIFAYGAGAWTHINASEWTRVACTFKLSVMEGKLYIVTTDADGNESFQLCKANEGDEDYAAFALMRFSFNATVGADIYADTFACTEIASTSSSKPSDPTEEYDGPKGFAGGDDASILPGNMMNNATFDSKIFSNSVTNSGIWYYESPEKVTINEYYSQDGTDSGSCAELSNRQGATASFQVRSLHIWVSNVYTIKGYVSSKQATKGSLYVKCWGYNDDYTDEQAVLRYPFALYQTDLAELKPGEWTEYEVTFGWVYNSDTRILTLQIYKDGEVWQEVNTAECTGLSSFEFGFITDETNENYLSDLYFDNYSLMNVTKEILGGGDDSSDSGDSGDSGNGGGVVIPGGDDSGDEKKDSEKGKGCGSSVGFGATMAIAALGTAVVALKKGKKED